MMLSGVNGFFLIYEIKALQHRWKKCVANINICIYTYICKKIFFGESYEGKN